MCAIHEYIQIYPPSPPNIDIQVQLVRIQKERDQFSDELETLKERSESSQTLLMKAARDREAMQTDLEVLKERYEKSHAIQQKLQVIVEDSQKKGTKKRKRSSQTHTHKLAYQLALLNYTILYLLLLLLHILYYTNLKHHILPNITTNYNQKSHEN